MLGKLVLFVYDMLGPVSIRRTAIQCMQIGFYSILIVAVTSLFVGFVLVLQAHYAFERTGIEGYIGSVVSLSLTRELGPVLTGMVVAGRVGGSIAAEIGSMKITEQLDAMAMLNVNVMHYLVQPRVIASTLMFPLLCIISVIIGSIGGYICVCYLGISKFAYIDDMLSSLRVIDISVGLIKSTTFGLITSVISCFSGLNTQTGSHGVGFAVTQAIIFSSMGILILNSLYTWLFLGW